MRHERPGLPGLTLRSGCETVRSGAMETRFYHAESKEDVEALMTALTSFVFPGTWETDGGEGVMVQVGAKLVIRQTPEVHKAIAEFIRELQAAGARASGTDSGRR